MSDGWRRLPTTEVDAFAALLAEELGYSVQPENQTRVARVLAERAAAASGGDARAYVSLLRDEGKPARAEWQEVIRELAIGESFFFRDTMQFRLLREDLLPRLVRRRAPRRTLRIWSAGCSTGEEPYSVAILVRELLAGQSGWNVTIVGTDVNEASLAQARRASYSAWSLRGLSEEQRVAYFTRDDGRFRLRPEYRSMVSFQRSNLVKDRVPSFASGLHAMDLILCRNVFIYFDAATTGRVAEKLAHALAPGGFLVTGHAELHGQRLTMLHTQFLPGSAVHERPAFELPAGVETPVAPPRAVDPPPAAAQRADRPEPPAAAARSILEEAREAFARADYATTIDLVERFLREQPDDEVALRLAAVAAANLGDEVEAARHCRRILAFRPKDIEARYLLAKLAEDRDNEQEAREVLLQIVDDAPWFAPAYLDLAWIEQRRGDPVRAANLREEALRLLEQLPPKAILSAYEGVTVEDLLAQLRPPGQRSRATEDA